MGLARAIEKAWYQPSPGWLWLLLPLEGLFRLLSGLRRWRSRPVSSGVPVIVVGNLAVGGSGKTPLVLALAAGLSQRGYRVGICSRGYGGKAGEYPCLVTPQSDPHQVGDEPLLLARRSGLPVVVDPNRPRAVAHLRQHSGCDLVISDDGLQHYAMARTVEIAVIDGSRNLGNGHCLPVGPLREPVGRLAEVDFVVVNRPGPTSPRGDAMQLSALGLQPLGEDAAGHWPAHRQRVHAVAGIGNPERFFTTLGQMGLIPIPHAFADHHPFSADDFAFDEALPIVMTEKDAVKCRALGLADAWFVPVAAELPEDFIDRVAACVRP